MRKWKNLKTKRQEVERKTGQRAMISDARRQSEKRKARREIEEAKERERGGKNIPTRALAIVGSATNANNQTDRSHKKKKKKKKKKTKRTTQN